jgi:hypothetical protein
MPAIGERGRPSQRVDDVVQQSPTNVGAVRFVVDLLHFETMSYGMSLRQAARSHGREDVRLRVDRELNFGAAFFQDLYDLSKRMRLCDG